MLSTIEFTLKPLLLSTTKMSAHLPMRQITAVLIEESLHSWRVKPRLRDEVGDGDKKTKNKHTNKKDLA
jgi:hypothetical protein